MQSEGHNNGRHGYEPGHSHGHGPGRHGYGHRPVDGRLGHGADRRLRVDAGFRPAPPLPGLRGGELGPRRRPAGPPGVAPLFVVPNTCAPRAALRRSGVPRDVALHQWRGPGARLPRNDPRHIRPVSPPRGHTACQNRGPEVNIKYIIK